MITNVSRTPHYTRGLISGGPDTDVYVFDLIDYRWAYRGKMVVGESHLFIPAEDQGYEHIPQEFYYSLDKAWSDPNGLDEFSDPFLDSLMVQGA